ncbi:MAG: hypothetical protein WAM88_04500 [Nitrososphaeraceae archaeon]
MSSRFSSHTITGSFESKGFGVRNATSSDLPIVLQLGRIVAKRPVR